MRDRDDLFDAMIEALGHDPAHLTRSERGRINRALMELREVKATPDQLRARAKEYRRRWPTIDCTAQAIAGNWNTLGPSRLALAKAEKVLERLMAEHQRGANKSGDARRYVMEKLTAEQRSDPAIAGYMERFNTWPQIRLTA